jgi:AraC-like DNA-binding protein
MFDLDKLAVHLHLVLDKPTYPGWEDKRNLVKVHTFYWIREGRGWFYTDEEIKVEGGILAYLKPGLQMRMRSAEPFPLHMTMVMFNCALLDYKGGWSSPSPVMELELPFLTRINPAVIHDMNERFERISGVWAPGTPGGTVPAKAELLKLLHRLHERDSGAEHQRSDAAYSAFERVKQHMDFKYGQLTQIEELADLNGISVSHLRKLFILHTGMSPKDYRSRIRNEHAVRYLAYTELPIKEIAALCGYPEEFHFSKSFKKWNGVPPSQYRRMHRGG